MRKDKGKEPSSSDIEYRGPSNAPLRYRMTREDIASDSAESSPSELDSSCCSDSEPDSEVSQNGDNKDEGKKPDDANLTWPDRIASVLSSTPHRRNSVGVSPTAHIIPDFPPSLGKVDSESDELVSRARQPSAPKIFVQVEFDPTSGYLGDFTTGILSFVWTPSARAGSVEDVSESTVLCDVAICGTERLARLLYPIPNLVIDQSEPE